MTVPPQLLGMGQGSSFQLANDDRFAAAVGDFTASPVNNFSPFAEPSKAGGAAGIGLTASASLGPVLALVIGGGALAYAWYKGRRR